VWVVAALPGVEPQDLEVSIEGGLLVIAGVRRLPTMTRGTIIHRLEIPHGRFERRIRTPGAKLQVERSELVTGCLYISLTKLR
jgi:HSP20 family molecular chaperone IbpA